MKQLSRETLLNALINSYPDRPKVFFEVMSNEELHVAFKKIAEEHSTILRQYRSVEAAR